MKHSKFLFIFFAVSIAGCATSAVRPPIAVLGVDDVDRAAEVYCNALLFDCDPALRFLGARPDEGSVYAIVGRDEAVVHLQIRRWRRPAREDHEVDVVVTVDDVHARFDACRAQRLRIVRPLGTDDGTAFTVEDPSGNRVTIRARSGEDAP